MSKAVRTLVFLFSCTLVALGQDSNIIGPNTNLYAGNPSTANPVGLDVWSGVSLVAYMPGGSLLLKPGASTAVKIVIGFVAGSQVDITQAALVITKVGQKNIINTPVVVKYNGVANPSINLTGTGGVCPGQVLSYQNPCYVQFDSATLSFQNTNDLYFGVFFTSDSNNSTVLLTRSQKAGNILTWFEQSNVVASWALNAPVTLPDEGRANSFWGIQSVSK